MVRDAHIHINDSLPSPEEFRLALAQAGVSGGLLFSRAPAAFDNQPPRRDSARRLQEVLDFCRPVPGMHPFFFIDPLEPDALEQIDRAVEAGIAGFKAICCHHYPQDDRPMEVWTHIAKRGKPLLLHSGILYNCAPSANFNRPGNFEDLIFIPNLRFALAHISWPWCDELVAVFGKWNYFAYESGRQISSQLYVDLTPGTPPCYRKEALSRLWQVGYPTLPEHMIFGTDGNAHYDAPHIQKLIAADREIYRELGLSEQQQEKVFSGNLDAFLKL